MTNPFDPAEPPSKAHDFLADMRLTEEQQRQADELAKGALAVAEAGGDVADIDAWLRGWAKRQREQDRT